MINNQSGRNTNSSSSGSLGKDILNQVGNYLGEGALNNHTKFKAFLQAKKEKRVQAQKIAEQEKVEIEKALKLYRRHLVRKALRAEQKELKLKNINQKLETTVADVATENQKSATKTQILIETEVGAFPVSLDEKESTCKQINGLVASYRENLNASKKVNSNPISESFSNVVANDENQAKNSNQLSGQQTNADQWQASINLQSRRVKAKSVTPDSRGFAKTTKLVPKLRLNDSIDRLVIKPHFSVANQNLVSSAGSNHMLVSPLLEQQAITSSASNISNLFSDPILFLAISSAAVKLSYKKNRLTKVVFIGSYKIIVQIINALKALPQKLSKVLGLRGGKFRFRKGSTNEVILPQSNETELPLPIERNYNLPFPPNEVLPLDYNSKAIQELQRMLKIVKLLLLFGFSNFVIFYWFITLDPLPIFELTPFFAITVNEDMTGFYPFSFIFFRIVFPHLFLNLGLVSFLKRRKMNKSNTQLESIFEKRLNWAKIIAKLILYSIFFFVLFVLYTNAFVTFAVFETEVSLERLSFYQKSFPEMLIRFWFLTRYFTRGFTRVAIYFLNEIRIMIRRSIPFLNSKALEPIWELPPI